MYGTTSCDLAFEAYIFCIVSYAFDPTPVLLLLDANPVFGA